MVTANSGEGGGFYLGPRSSTALTALEKPWAENAVPGVWSTGHSGAPLCISLSDSDVG